MMKPLKRLVFLGLAGCIFLLSGCSHRLVVTGGGTYRVLPAGYSCIAINTRPGGQGASAWARRLFKAKKLVLARCRARSRYPNACHVQFCRWVAGAPISQNGYFTCYVKSIRQYGVWLSTSHNENWAKSNAMYRCQRYSHDSSACYFDHCWLW